MKFPIAEVPARKTHAVQSGFTLTEMMVAVTVSLFLIGALVTIVLGSSSTGRTREQASDLQVNGRYAMEQIKNDLLHAGYLGISSLFFPDQAITVNGINVTGACDASAVGQLSQRVRGTSNSNPYAATCIPAARYSTGDVLVIRGLNPTPVTAPFSTTRVYYHSAYEGGQPFVGPTVPDFTASSKQPPYVDFQLQETAYYVSPYTTAATETPLVPALYRTRLGAGPAMAAELVVTGVENMGVRYGVFQTDKTTRYLAADEISAADWDLVKSVQVWLLVRSVLPDSGYQNNNTYTMGAQNVTVNDSFRRLLLSSVIELRN